MPVGQTGKTKCKAATVIHFNIVNIPYFIIVVVSRLYLKSNFYTKFKTAYFLMLIIIAYFCTASEYPENLFRFHSFWAVVKLGSILYLFLFS